MKSSQLMPHTRLAIDAADVDDDNVHLHSCKQISPNETVQIHESEASLFFFDVDLRQTMITDNVM